MRVPYDFSVNILNIYRMKKIILSAVMFCSVFFATVQAQTTTSFGVKLNGNLTNVKLSDIVGSSTSFKPGGAIGGFAKIEFNEHFALQPELLFSYTESKVKFNHEKIRFKYAGVEIPVYALGQFTAGNGKFFIGAGPHIGYGFSIDTKTEKIPDGAPGDNKIELDHWYMGGGVMAGYEFRNRIIINAGYQLGFDLSSKSKSSDVKTQTISLGIGYRF